MAENKYKSGKNLNKKVANKEYIYILKSGKTSIQKSMIKTNFKLRLRLIFKLFLKLILSGKFLLFQIKLMLIKFQTDKYTNLKKNNLILKNGKILTHQFLQYGTKFQTIFNKNGIIFNLKWQYQLLLIFQRQFILIDFQKFRLMAQRQQFFIKKLVKRRINVDHFFTTFALEQIIQKFLKQVFQCFYFSPRASPAKQKKIIMVNHKINQFHIILELNFRSVLSNERILVNQILQMITKLFQTK
ncbi:hypothetical protein ABPG72_008772 [Tetrahymena utriculariae]